MLNKYPLTHLSCVICSVLFAHSVNAQAIESDKKIEKMVVTASGYEQSLMEAPASISLITAEELKLKSYTDVTDALMHVTGVQIMGGGVEQTVLIRGMTSDYTLFLIDGRPAQRNDAFGLNGGQAGTPINFLPPIEAIERIEVIRGPASSLYGSDAMGGVVNVITKKVDNDWKASVTSEYSHASSSNKVNEDGFQTSFHLNAPLIEDKLSLQITGSYLNQEESEFVGGSDNAASDPEYRKKNIGTKLGWRLNDDNTFTMGNTYSKQERTHTPGISLAEDDEESYNESIKNEYFLTHDGSYEGFDWKSFINYDTSENPSRVNETTGKGIDYDVLTLNTQGVFYFDRHTLSVGATYTDESLEDGATNGLREPVIADANAVIEMDRYQYSVFLEDHWDLLDDLSLTLSGRYDDNEKFGSNFSPKAYAVYRLSDDFVLKGGVTTGFKAPSLRQSATDFGSTSMGGVIIGNPELKPEKSTNYEIALGYNNDDLDLNTTLTAYLTDFKDKINRTGRVCLQNEECTYNGTTYPAHQYGYTAYENVAEAQLKGIEWTFDYGILDTLKYRHSYTFTDTEQKTGDYAGEPLNDLAKHMVNASLDWQATSELMLWVQTNYRSETTGRWQTGTSGASTNGVKYPSYMFFDIGAVYRPKENISLKAGVYNVANKEVTTEEDYAYILDGRRYIVSFTYNF